MKLRNINPRIKSVRVVVTRYLNRITKASGKDGKLVVLEREYGPEDNVDLVVICPNGSCTCNHNKSQVFLNGKFQYEGINCTPFIEKGVAEEMTEIGPNECYVRCTGYDYLHPNMPSMSCDSLAKIELHAEYEAHTPSSTGVAKE